VTHRTTVLFSTLERVEIAIDWLADTQGMLKRYPDGCLLTEEERDDLWQSPPTASTRWVFALRATSRCCIVKTLPLQLLSAPLWAAPSRPMVATLAAALGRRGFYSEYVGSDRLVIESDSGGSCFISGMLSSDVDLISNFTESQIRRLAKLPELGSDEYDEMWGTPPQIDPHDAIKTISTLAGLEDSEWEDSVLWKIVCDDKNSSKDKWSILIYDAPDEPK